MNTGNLKPLWRHNPALAHLLGLSPLLAMSHSLALALGLGIATLALIAAAAPLLAALHPRLSPELRIPAAVLLLATLAACLELLLQAFRLPLYQSFGVFLPLIAATSLSLLEAPATTPAAARYALVTGSGYLLALAALGAIRESLAHGTLFRDFELLAGTGAAGRELRLLPAGYDFPFWALPAGGFIALGFLIALHRALSARPGADAAPPASAERARVTDTPALPEPR